MADSDDEKTLAAYESLEQIQVFDLIYLVRKCLDEKKLSKRFNFSGWKQLFITLLAKFAKHMVKNKLYLYVEWELLGVFSCFLLIFVVNL